MVNQVENANAVVQLLLDRAGDFSQELQTSIMKGGVSVRETTDYVTKAISDLSGTINMVEASTDRKEGTTTFNGNYFKQNVAKLIDAIEIRVGKGDPANFGAIKFNQSLPAALLNAHLIIEQSGRKLLEKKVSDFVPEGTEIKAEDKFVALQLPLIIRDVEAFEIKVRFPSGSSVGAAATEADTENVKISFRAYETGRKA